MTDAEQKIMNALREIYKQNVELKHFLEQALGVSARPEPKPKAKDQPWNAWIKKDEQNTNTEEDKGFKLWYTELLSHCRGQIDI